MDRYTDLSLWIEVAAILVIGVALLLLVQRGVTLMTGRARFTPLAMTPLRFLIRWAGVLIILGLLVNKLFQVNLMSIIFGGLALVAIGVVAVWSMLSHMTATKAWAGG